MPLTKTHEEPTTDARTGTAFYFAASGPLWSDTIKVVERSTGVNLAFEGHYLARAWRSDGWTGIADDIEATSPERAAQVALLILGRGV